MSRADQTLVLLRIARGPLVAVALLAFSAIGLALILQHAYGYAPCPWCTFQRLIFLLIGFLALVVLLFPRRARASVWIAAWIPVLALGGAAAAWHQHTVAAQSDSCALTLADRVMGALGLPELWPAMFEATARCDEANLPWLAVPFAIWSLLLYLVLTLLGVWAFRSRPHTLFLK